MGEKTNLQLKPIEKSALYRRRMLDDKYRIEQSEEVELNYFLNSLSQNSSGSKLETLKLSSRFPVGQSQLDKYEGKRLHLENGDENSR